MAEPIPEAWRKDVIRILWTNDRRLIEWTTPALQRWETDTFGDAQEYEAYDAMIEMYGRRARAHIEVAIPSLTQSIDYLS